MVVVVLVIAWGATVLARMNGPQDLHTRDQPRTAAYTQDMLNRSEFILPTDTVGLPATKPLLVNWIGLPWLWAMGPGPWSLKAPSILASLVFVLLTARVAFGLVATANRGLPPGEGGTGPPRVPMAVSLDPGAFALITGLTALGTHMIVKHSTLLRPDMVMAAGLSLAMLSAMRLVGWIQPTPGRKPWPTLAWAVMLWLGVWMAAMTKGFPALIPVVFVVVAARLATGRFRAVGRTGLLWGLPVVAALVGLWLALAYQQQPEHTIQRIFGYELVNRTAGEGRFVHLTTSYKVPAYWVTRHLPWAVLAIIGMVVLFKDAAQARRDAQAQPNAAKPRPTVWRHPLAPALLWLLPCWGLVLLSAGKRADYLLPATAATAILSAYALLVLLRKAKRPTTLGVGLAAMVLGGHLAVAWSLRTDETADRDGEDLLAFVQAIEEKTGPRAQGQLVVMPMARNPLPTLLGLSRVLEADEQGWVALPSGAEWVVREVDQKEPGDVSDAMGALAISEPMRLVHRDKRETRLGLYRVTETRLRSTMEPKKQAQAGNEPKTTDALPPEAGIQP